MSMKFVSVGIDLGNSMLKAVKEVSGKKVRVKVPNRIQYDKAINPKAKKVEFDGNTIFVGVGELNNNVQKHSRKHLLEQTFVMINELYPNESELKVDLRLGLPPIQYFNDSYKSNFASMFPVGKQFEFTIDGIAKKVTFVSLEIFVEGYSAFVSNIESIGDNKQDILSIDVGGGTTDICSFSYDYDDEMYYPNDTLTIPKGVIDYGLEIAKHFNEVENADISSKYIDSLLKNNIEEIEYKGKKYKLENYLSSIDPIVYDTTNKITNKFGELDRYIVVGVGGGYKTYNRIIKDRIASEIELDEDSQFFGNAEGYLEQFGFMVKQSSVELTENYEVRKIILTVAEKEARDTEGIFVEQGKAQGSQIVLDELKQKLVQYYGAEEEQIQISYGGER